VATFLNTWYRCGLLSSTVLTMIVVASLYLRFGSDGQRVEATAPGAHVTHGEPAMTPAYP
jgi:hypothetical protein